VKRFSKIELGEVRTATWLKSLAATCRTTLFRSPTMANVPSFLGYLSRRHAQADALFSWSSPVFPAFVRYYAANSGPSDFRSTPALVDAFDKLKDGIANAATLAPLDYPLPIIVRPDASKVGLEGGVWNRLPDGTLRLVLMFSARKVPYLVPHSNVDPTFLRSASHGLLSVHAYRETLRHLRAILFH
jgi:hypothetical protein